MATAGTANTGGGGGGAGEASSNPGKPGGSGVVIVKYAGPQNGSGGVITSVGGYTIHTFNSNGSFVYNGGSTSATVPNTSNLNYNNLLRCCEKYYNRMCFSNAFSSYGDY